MASVFFSYSHKDEQLRDMLETHLAMLQNQGLIHAWHDRRILPGDEFEAAISEKLETADLILLLVSSDFLSSRYCYDVEMKRALERHQEGTARVIPIILRACDWHSAPFGKLLGLPNDGNPIKLWPDIDQAFLDVVKGIRRALEKLSPASAAVVEEPNKSVEVAARAVPETQRSSNLRLKKVFSDADRDSFVEEGFMFMSAFFAESLKELENRNSDISTKFQQIDTDRFVAKIYRAGVAVAQCKITANGMFGRGITFSNEVLPVTNSANENLSVMHDDQSLFFSPMGMGLGDGLPSSSAKLTFEGASEYYWALLVRRLQ